MRWVKRAAFSAAAVVVLALVAWLGAPPLVKWQLETRLTAMTGRSVTVERVRFRPWNLALTLQGLAVAGQGGGDPLLRIGSADLNLSLSSLFRLAPVIEELVIDAPELRVARVADGRYDFDDVLAKFAAQPAAPAEAKPAPFAFYNVQVKGGKLRFDDRPSDRVHTVEQLTLTLPFLSSMPAQVDVKVEPRLAFKLNGAAFDTGVQATPFAQTRQGELKLDVRDLDIAPYLGYLPASLPMRPVRGHLTVDVGLRFVLPHDGTPTIVLQGNVGARDVAIEHGRDVPFVGWKHLTLELKDVQPLARHLAFGALRIDGAKLALHRDKAGRLTLAQALASAPAEPLAASPASAARAASAASGATSPNAAETPAWRVSLASLVFADAAIAWRDDAVTPAASLTLDSIAIDARNLQWPVKAPMPVKLAATLRAAAPLASASAPSASASAQNDGTLSAEGLVHTTEAGVSVVLKDLSLPALQPYIAQTLVPTLEGRVSVAGRVDWQTKADAPRLAVQVDSASVDTLRVLQRAGGKGATQPPSASLSRLDVAGVQVDLLQRTATVGSVKLAKPMIALARDSQGQFNVTQWARDTGGTSATPSSPAQAASAVPPWHVQLRDLAVEDGTVRLNDAHASGGRRSSQSVNVEVQQLRLRLQAAAWRGDTAVPAAKVQLKALVRGPASEGAGGKGAGVIDVDGDLGLQPMLLAGQVRIDRFPVHRFAPYFADAAPMRLQRGEVSYRGKVAVRQLPAGLDVAASGDLLLGDVRVATLERGEEVRESLTGDPDDLFSWQSLALRKLNVVLKPGARPRVEVGSAALNQFYSRLVVTEDGRFNFQEPPAAAGTPVAVVVAASAVTVAEPASAPASAPVSRPAEAPSIDLVIGGTKLSNGSIDFSDRLVRPNYSAALTELQGEIGPFRSDSREMATVSLRGRAAGTASLDIQGKLNPAVKPLALDIQARATDLELAPLSPYAGKYAGYAIERGKLSLEVSYRIDGDGTLDAKNRVVLNQLTFGERIESPTATQLPVRLAVALMKDRNGVIDLELPVSGSVNDPQFSVGGIVWRLIGNLLVKAVTSPFSLLSGGGSEDLSQVAFAPGSAVLTPEGLAAIDKVAKALTERPALKMTVTGAAGPQTEQVAYQRLAIDTRLQADQRREGQGVAAAASAPAAAPLNAAERSRLLKALYDRSKLADKPRNALGLARALPDAEMEVLLRQLVPTSEETWRQLAVQRGVVVRDALIAKGLPSERLFLSAPKLHAVVAGEAPWTPAVQLTLAER